VSNLTEDTLIITSGAPFAEYSVIHAPAAALHQESFVVELVAEKVTRIFNASRWIFENASIVISLAIKC
jgi:hypothetical protein